MSKLFKSITMAVLILTLLCLSSCLYMSKPVPQSEIATEASAFEDYSQALILFDKNEYQAALEMVNKAIALNNRIAKFLLLKAEILQKMGRPYDALQSYDRLLKIKSYNPEVYEKMGRLSADIQQYDSAIQYIKKALAQKPESTNLLLLIADYYLKSEAFDRADSYLNLYQNQTKSALFSNTYFCLKAQVYFNQARYKETIEALDRCQETEKLNAHLHKIKLDAYLNEENFDQFYKHLMALTQDQLSKADFHFYRGIYFFHKQNYRDALAELNFALELKTEDSRVYYYLGKVYLELGDSAKSKETFELYRIKTRQPQLQDIKAPGKDD